MNNKDDVIPRLVDDLSRGLLDANYRVAFKAHNALFKR